MAKKEKWGLTDEQVEQEIERLNASDAVALVRYEQRLKYRRRQYLYQLRALEKQGKEMMKAGITRETLDAMYRGDALDETEQSVYDDAKRKKRI